MKSTKIFLAVIIAVTTMWMFTSIIHYLMSENTTFSSSASAPITKLITLLLGTVSACVVANDLDTHLKKDNNSKPSKF